MGIPVTPGKQVESQVPTGDADPNQTFKCCSKPSQLWPGRDRGHPVGGCDLTWHAFKFSHNEAQQVPPLTKNDSSPLYGPLVGLYP